MILPVGPKCWHDWDKKWWRCLYYKYHLGVNNRCDKNVPWHVSDTLIQGLHCSCLTPPVMVQPACRKNMISASIQQMLHLGCIKQWFSNLDLPFESSEVSQNTETEMSSFWWNFHHWLHWKLSKWQLPVQPVMKISSKWRHFRFSESEEE